MRPGLWRRAGLFGEVAGLDYTAAMIFAPEGCDKGDYAHFLACAEAGLMQAVEEARRETSDGE